MKKNKSLPQTGQVDIVSPATRLLEKRRQMYENQEHFMEKKKQFQQAEINFRAKEKSLRDKDASIQEQIIKYANYLDLNQKAMRKCDDNIIKLEEEIKEKNSDYDKKQWLHGILKQKEVRITKKRAAVEAYQQFLYKVQDENRDEYNEIKKILERYYTLQHSQDKLLIASKEMEQELIDRQKQVANYEAEMSTNIMKINNEIINKKKEHDDLVQRLMNVKLGNQAAGQATRDVTRFFSRVVMAIQNLENACFHRRQHVPDPEFQRQSKLNYTGEKYMAIEERAGEPATFDDYPSRFQYAKLSLDAIEHYLKDFKEIQRKFAEKALYNDLGATGLSRIQEEA